MPFVSQAQRGFMYAKHPKLAKEFEAKTPSGPLPQYVNGPKKSNYDGVKNYVSGNKAALKKIG